MCLPNVPAQHSRTAGRVSLESAAPRRPRQAPPTPSLLRRAGLGDIEVHVRVIAEREFKPDTLGYWQVQVIDEWLRAKGLATAQELDDWHADLQYAADRGDYLFSANRYICVGRRA